MLLEVELKFPLADRQAIMAQLVARGASFQPPHREIDRYFQHPGRDFRATDEAVRLRSIGETNYLTYKGPKLDLETKTRQEIELAIGPGAENRERALQWLTAVGFSPIAEVTKTRVPGSIHWAEREVTIALDAVDGLGEFVEFELLAEPADFAAAKAALLSLANALGLSTSERRGYLNLLLAKRGIT